MKEKLKNKKGITLVALIITVIILLILAGVTISLLIGDNGMVKKTKQGVEESEMASIKEQAELVRNEQGIRNFEGNPQELTKSSYINALNVSFENSIVEGSRVIVKDKKYAIFVKSNLEIEVIKNDGKTLAEGEMKLDYTVSEDGLIEIYPRIGGVESYKLYAEKILEGKTQGEKEQMCLNGWKYWDPEGFANVFGEKENPTFDDWVNIRNASIENEEEKISKEKFIEELILYSEVNSFDELLIKEKFVKPEWYDFDKYSEVEIEVPSGNKLITDTDTLCVTYKVYQKGEYKFIGNVIEGEYKGTTAEVTVPVTIDLPQLEDDEVNPELQSMKLRINVTEDNKTIQLPISEYENYDFKVNWGDETEEQTITNENLDSAKHTYTNIDTYTITISGVYEYLYVSWENESIKQALVKIEQWGTTGLKKIYLEECVNLEEIASPSKNSFVNMTNFDYSFRLCASLERIPQYLFINCPNVARFEGTFSDCSKLTGNSIHLWEEGREGINEKNGGFGCYAGCYNLEDYKKIPKNWKILPN